MRAYVCTSFKGHFPVGTAAVMVANDRGHALRLLAKKLEGAGLEVVRYDDKPLTLDDIEGPLNLAAPGARILLDGNY